MWRRRIAAVTAGMTLIALGLAVPAARGDGPGEPLYGLLDGDLVVDRASLGTAPPRNCAVLVEIGRPDGGYLPPRPHTYRGPGGGARTGCPDLGVAVDLDGTGPAELVVGWYGGRPGGYDNDLLILTGFRVSGGLRSIHRPNFIGAADFDGDGRQDVYEWTDQGEGFVTYLNDGTGGLLRGPVRYCASRLEHDLADFDRDGATDVVLAYVQGCEGHTRGVAVLLDDGRVVDLQGVWDDQASWTAHVLDADRDGVPDVLTYELPTGELTTFLGVGDGTFVASPLAAPDAVTVSRSGPTRIRVRANDYASLRARVSIVEPPSFGTVRVTASQAVSYTPSGPPGHTDQFVYRLTQDGRTSDATVIVKIDS